MSSFEVIVNSIEKSLEKIEINSEAELAVLFIHSQFLDNNFKLISIKENDSKVKNEEKLNVLEKLPIEWNNTPNNWTFIYQHDTTNNKYYINIVKMMNMLTINSLILETEKVYSIQISLSNLFQECTFPLSKIEKKYFNEEKFKTIINNINLEIINKLLPTIKYHNELPVSQETSRILPQDDNEIEFNDPLRINRPNIRRNPVNPMVPNPGNFDLDPFNSMGPSGGGGLIMGPNNPIFNNIGDDYDLESGGFYGGPTILPPGAVPAGARFDPIGPFGNQSSRRNFNNRNRNNRNKGFNSFEPDNDIFFPPGGGNDNMFL